MNFLCSIKSAKALGLAAATAITMLATNVAPSQSQVVSSRRIHLLNRGGYVARFEVSYTTNGQRVTKRTGDVLLGMNVNFEIPGNATDVNVNSFLFTGFLNTTRPIFNQTFRTISPTICFKVFGPTFNPQLNHECR